MLIEEPFRESERISPFRRVASWAHVEIGKTKNRRSKKALFIY
jgi:hypothetical protein